ncbi:MAG TPA: glycerophosphodiester phosphodiesterase [Gemmatimonadaceae bacterium]|nr:glycerophosphodiester phosphodiesterase [Gemmatimonadaceae bacterium]
MIVLDRSCRPVVAHRGNRAHAPENTLEAFAQAVAIGADALEFDIRVTAEGIPVVMHDPDVRRTTDGSGEVARMSFAQIQSLDAGARFTKDNGTTFPYRGKGHRVPSFDEVLDAFPAIPMIIEIKTTSAAQAVRRAIEAHRAEDRVLVDSLETATMTVFADSRIPVGATRADAIRTMTEITLHLPLTPFVFEAFCLPPSYNGIPVPVRSFAKACEKQGKTLHIWTINDPAVATELWTKGVQGIITDDPATMLKTRERLPR